MGPIREENDGKGCGETDVPHSEWDRAFPQVNPIAEDRYWQQCFQTQAYFDPQYEYDDYAPAYRLGIAQRLGPNGHTTWRDSQEILQALWPRRKGFSRLSWDQARDAVCAAWNRIDNTLAWSQQ